MLNQKKKDTFRLRKLCENLIIQTFEMLLEIKTIFNENETRNSKTLFRNKHINILLNNVYKNSINLKNKHNMLIF